MGDAVKGSVDAMLDQFSELEIPDKFVPLSVLIIRIARGLGISYLEKSLQFLDGLKGDFGEYSRIPTERFAEEIEKRMEKYLANLKPKKEEEIEDPKRVYRRGRVHDIPQHHNPKYAGVLREDNSLEAPILLQEPQQTAVGGVKIKSTSLEDMTKRGIQTRNHVPEIRIAAYTKTIYEHAALTDIIGAFNIGIFPFTFSADREEVTIVLEFLKKRRRYERMDPVMVFSLYPQKGRIGIKSHGKASLISRDKNSATYDFGTGRNGYGRYTCTIYFTNPNH